jgi:hypothetical protein
MFGPALGVLQADARSNTANAAACFENDPVKGSAFIAYSPTFVFAGFERGSFGLRSLSDQI